jgi:hypothetical protein
MDDIARRYILLCLRLERLAPGFLDSYIGPAELSEAVAAEPMPLPAELHDEAVSLRALAAGLGGESGPATCRARWLEGQLRSIAVQARRAGGEEIAFVDLLEELYGVPIGPVPEADLLAARQRLDNALPGDGPLRDRIKAQREATRVPPERILDVVIASAERFRAVTRRDFDLPENEEIAWEETRDQPWGAEARFEGSGRTRIKVNLDLPLPVSAAAYLASHEAYPGHHAEHVTKERTLVRAGVGEAAMRTMNTPESMLAEGLADVGREVVMSDRELATELERIGNEVGLRADWLRAVEVHEAMQELAPTGGNAAFLLHHDGRPADEVRAWAREISGMDEQQLDHAFRVLAHPLFRTYPFTYTEGARLIRPWLEVVGQTTGYRRLLSEQLSPAQLMAELHDASA